MFEDVHWADAAQLDLITYLAAHTRDSPVMFLALARPELFDRCPGWGSGTHAQSTLTLDPLSDDEASVIEPPEPIPGPIPEPSFTAGQHDDVT